MARADTAKKHLDNTIISAALKCLAATLATLFLVTVVQVVLLKYIDPPGTVGMLWRRVQHAATSTRYTPVKFLWRPLADISPHLQKAVLAGEDQRFLRHSGFDGHELNQALKDLLAHNRIRGASTISMQTARSVFLSHSRSVPRKIAEAYYTILIELLWDKRRIFEMYLNTVDWGHGVRGAEAASRYYFNHHADRLSRREASLLAAILPSPHLWSPLNPGSLVIARQKRILSDMPAMLLP